MTTFRIYGNGDTRPGLGFPDSDDFRAYIGGKIFTENHGRYHYSEIYAADTIVMSRDGWAYGHFEVADVQVPTPADIAEYDKTKAVYLVTRSVVYEKPVRLKELGFVVRQRGLSIEQGDFDKIVALAGRMMSFTAAAPLESKYCRVCYNSNGWRTPSRAADETGSYFAANGFGHEEWLFNYEWCIDGYKYGFLQPFTRFLPKFQGSWFSIKLYTVHKGHALFVGTIRRVYIPQDDELAAAFGRIQANGWLDQMKADVAAVNGNVAALGGNDPNLIINVRFDPTDVVLNPDMPEFQDGSAPTKVLRYVPIDDWDELLPEAALPAMQALSPMMRSELQYLRAAQQGTIVDPRHARLQNRLYDWLCTQHGADAVGFEFEFVDLRVTLPGATTFYEIKTDSSAKRCIRNALGQLFEYSTYATVSKAGRWIVVGDPVPTDDDVAYLAHLRKTFALPLFYAQFDWQSGALRIEV